MGGGREARGQNRFLGSVFGGPNSNRSPKLKLREWSPGAFHTCLHFCGKVSPLTRALEPVPGARVRSAAHVPWQALCGPSPGRPGSRTPVSGWPKRGRKLNTCHEQSPSCPFLPPS